MPPKRKLSQPADLANGAPAQASTFEPAAARTLVDEEAFVRALDALACLDAGFMTTMRAAGELPRLRRREPGFAGLAAIIVSQQVSTASANAIFGRLQGRYPNLAPSDIVGSSDDELRLCGLSAPKIRTLRAIAAAVTCGTLDFAALARNEAEVAHSTLCAINGIGPWTADIFLLFCLGHADAWPVGDLALQEGARIALGLEARPDAKTLQSLGDRWRPWRGVVAHCLWAYYGQMRARPTTPQPTADATGTRQPRKIKPPGTGAKPPSTPRKQRIS